jgi:hypothetical protein
VISRDDVQLGTSLSGTTVRLLKRTSERLPPRELAGQTGA